MEGTDEVLRIDWLRDPSTASNGLRLLRDLGQKYSHKGLSEADTLAIFVEPVLRGLGWDTLSISQLGRESRRADPICDMQLLYDNKVAVAIETKALDYDRVLTDYNGQLKGDITRRLLSTETGIPGRRMTESQRWNTQHRLEHRGSVFVYGVLTNGRRWFAYDFTTKIPIPTEAFDKLRPLISENGLDLLNCHELDVARLAAVLGRDALHASIQEWKAKASPAS
ncbi:MAG TPA: hypothetical protein VJW77_00405 [Terriglobia bacterium]|nr:hypothetical protein [Terriglobia bacterium]